MSARSKMTMRALVQRDTSVGVDPDNNPADPAWTQLYAALPCWAWEPTERELMDARKVAVVGEVRAIVPKNTDINEKDRIGAIVDRRGTVMFAGALTVSTVINRRSHIELAMQAVT